MFDLLRDVAGFARAHRKLWLAPVIVALLVFGALIVVAEYSAVAPVVYTLF
jgi:uncharacterized membrane protein YjdF